MEFMFLALILAVGLFWAAPVQAAGEFNTNYSVDYRVGSDGRTRSKMTVELVNRLSNIYASEFSLSIGSTNLTDVRLQVDGQIIEPKIISGNTTTNITVVFPDKILGKDKVRNLSLEFTTTDFARRVGNVWEVSIPRLAKSEDLNSYQLTLTVPAGFGQASGLTPLPSAQTMADGLTVYRFSGASLFRSGISATFGREQWFDFSLDYHLKNPNLFPIATEVALPPDTAWQQVLYQTLDPSPATIRVDADGNWLATYRLGPSASLDVLATGSATLFFQPRSDYPWGINQTINYLQPQKYWEADQPRIKSLAGELKGAREIYDYVVDNLIYDYGRLGETPVRFGAANSLDNQNSALCMEFTDLFIALARAAGIPARAVNGFAYTDNASLRPLSLKQDVLHAWPEYYDRERDLWRPIDPTWGNTTGGVDFFNQTDLNHFAFVILGEDSAYPVPAGAYKTNDGPEKNVRVDFGKSVTPRPQLELSFNLPEKILAGVGLNGKILIKNSGNVALYQVPLTLSGQNLLTQPQTWEIAALPPQSRTEISFSLPASAWTSRQNETLTAQTDLARIQQTLALTPAYQLILASRGVWLAVSALGALVVLKLIHARFLKAKPTQ